MTTATRTKDITPLDSIQFQVLIDNTPVTACEGETVLSVLQATNTKRICENDKHVVTGAYCSMGVCHCCHVKINKRHKQRACQTLVEPNMNIETLSNRFKEEGLCNGKV
ncbi:2Fe-2S iron-sulfur cluster-binding protein [Pseudoalteromonas luteoviolacea]|uniref:2Fe-2S ferredoxin-type domain-containing protein n=3 Tax=Pseudoalteromonas luteoviolacea TaxID=43657 RepID=A0A167G2L9_9GAMM|nr:2Fe-2S iron-sulfur cluster-binding protein [Pseudoalteromonas luteoviolacea]KZN33564.1 hypothetical protein N480_23875 [Pseudoalteromonas luteoviolacea S2607]KZN53995.1 hypothetical protein N482_24685 [Pseudoalteromonas luteoviolacea NCIMB 1942]KZN66395.1 hypothetical protein N478_20230 [Pseudoalteromonas luteoviolacea S4060-1]KZX01985.1 (2Fe-2S)-binding protein [Pseudoalteromonas luteoviolacea]